MKPSAAFSVLLLARQHRDLPQCVLLVDDDDDAVLEEPAVTVSYPPVSRLDIPIYIAMQVVIRGPCRSVDS